MKDEPEMKGCPDSLPGYRLCLSHILVTHSKLGESLVIVGENSPHMEEHMNMKKHIPQQLVQEYVRLALESPQIRPNAQDDDLYLRLKSGNSDL